MDIIKVAKTIEKKGGRLYLVGGAVRDQLLDRDTFDEDYCVTGLTNTEFKELFPEAIIRGKTFEVYDLYGKEFALARKDIKEAEGHKGFRIITGKEITIEQDLKRRDITINSIAKDVLTGEIIDPFNGIEDIKQRRIKATGERFIEDPLRVYRVARLAAILEFEVEENTIKLMKELKGEILTLSRERIFAEFRKALRSNKPSIFFQVLKKAELLNVHFKEIYNLIGAIQPFNHHPEGDSYNHTLITLDNSCKLTDNIEVRFGALVHDLGKGVTPKKLYPHHRGHAERGIELVRKLGNRIGTPKSWIRIGVTSSKEHMRGGMFYHMSIKKQVEFIERVDKSLLGLDGLQIVVYSDKNRRGRDEYNNTRHNFADIGKKLLSEINGDYIKEKYKIEEGLEFGYRLHEERIKWMKENQK